MSAVWCKNKHREWVRERISWKESKQNITMRRQVSNKCRRFTVRYKHKHSTRSRLPLIWFFQRAWALALNESKNVFIMCNFTKHAQYASQSQGIVVVSERKERKNLTIYTKKNARKSCRDGCEHLSESVVREHWM